MDACQLIAERKIREAMEEGVFDRLEGAGKPLDLSENPFEDPAERMANRLLRNNGFTPAWIEEAKEIEAESRRLRAMGAESKSEILDPIATLNRRIVSYNLKMPVARFHKQLL